MSSFGWENLLLTENKCMVDKRQQTKIITATVLTRSRSLLKNKGNTESKERDDVT
jgi:hypothetical protein